MKTVYFLGIASATAFISLYSNNLIAQNNNSGTSGARSVPPYSNISSYSTNGNKVNRNYCQQTEAQEISTSEDGAYIVLVYDNNAVNTESSIREAGNKMMMASGPLTYSGPLKLDDDGTGSRHNDPHHTNTTSLLINGKSLNADTDSYVVAPGWLIHQGVKVGDKADVTYRVDTDGMTWSIHQTYYQPSVVGDVGPMQDRVGEMSIKAAENLGYGFRDTQNNGPVPTLYGVDCDPMVTIIFYPSGP